VLPIRDAIRSHVEAGVSLSGPVVAQPAPLVGDSKAEDSTPNEDVEMETGVFDFFPLEAEEQEVNIVNLTANHPIAEVRINLTGSPGRGFFWRLRCNQADVQVESEEYLPKEDAFGDQIGMDGEFTFVVRVSRPGQYQFHCAYLRPWLKGDAASKELTVTIMAHQTSAH